MKKCHEVFVVKATLASFFLVFSVFFFSSAGIVFGQGTPSSEICNGKDDNGDGVVDENLNCDHYLSYLLDKSIQPVTVTLRDQFINPTDFTLVLIERLLNPVRKLHEGLAFNPKRPNLHYLAYRLQSSASFAPRSVLIENQFEKNVIKVTKPRYLLTPTGKNKIGIPIEKTLSILPPAAANKLIAAIVPSIPKNANHYLCYDVEPYDITEGVSVRDQFQNRQFEVIRARYLCNPAEKTHNGKVSEIVDRSNHLMCYEVIPHNQVNRKVITHDQFGIKSQTAVRTEEICVPTVKTPLSPTACTRPDTEGTAVVLDKDTMYQNTGGQLTIVQPAPGTIGVTADAFLRSGPDTVVTRGGSPAAGETYTFDTEMLQLSLSSGRILNLLANGVASTSPRTPGDPVQSFDTEMLQLQGQLPIGDPDFDLLRITAGTDFGLPSPGHTTLTKLPDGNWNVDSFFDITYRIDFVGHPGGAYTGMSGSTTGTIRMADICPPVGPPPEIN
ncbi:MAG TPA: hypothetical protein DEF00_03660 [Candidatus Taylorbacteria bacterium]|nr:MAG: hypothetical protein UY03_C0001G0026 [Parcubacteria group bacterium GW2011_GWA2_47_64]KKU96172.1 MAG: hypothetical protein UY29_C0015G0012 [Parcubacteria group bacterium GW2011_GWC2_48_17]HBV01460.1 hypothetical protein [Candidatus Taylorbacteria bacterium]